MGPGTSVGFSQTAATTATDRMPTREEHPLITSGTGSSPAKRLSPGSWSLSHLTWTAHSTAPTRGVHTINFEIGWACIRGVKRYILENRRLVRCGGILRPASGAPQFGVSSERPSRLSPRP